LTASVSVALLLAPAAAGAATQGARAAIEEAGTAFSAKLAKGDAAGLAAMYTADAQAFPPNSDIVTGTAAIQKLWQGVIDSGIKSAKFTIVDVTEGGGLAAESGKYELSGADGTVVDSGKYVVVWKRVGGRWKILRDIWNTSRPAPAQ
jgi:ketosteroid isomerase-like protein